MAIYSRNLFCASKEIRRDGKWINHDSAFFIFNSDGKILSWQFTRGTSFVQVKKLLKFDSPESSCTE